MPLIYWGTDWFIGLALTSAFHLPIEFLLLGFLLPMVGFFLWRNDRHIRLIWFSLYTTILSVLRFAVSISHFEQNLSRPQASLLSGILLGLKAGLLEILRSRSRNLALFTQKRNTLPTENIRPKHY